MSLAIEATGIGKRYTLHPRRRADTLVRRIADAARGVPRESGQVFWALRGVNLQVAAGETVGLIGSNGAGKSTLLKILSRVTEPTEGRVAMTGRVASLLEVGTGFHPDLSARQNIYLNGAILGMRRQEITRRFDQIVEFAGVGQFLNEPVMHLSSGMYVRLAFSVAAFLESEILVMDEVLAVGDAAFQEKCLGTLRSAAQSGRAVLFVSHNLATVAQLAPRAVVIDRGEIAFDGPCAEAVQHYLHQKRQQPFTGRQPTSELQCGRRYRSGDSARIREIGPAPGQPAEIAPGGSVKLELLIESQASYDDLRILYSINSLAGTAVLTGVSPNFTVAPGRQVIELALRELNLAPGEYDYTVSIGKGGWGEGKTEYDAYGGFGRLVVSQATASGAPFGAWHPDCGAVFHRQAAIRAVSGPP